MVAHDSGSSVFPTHALCCTDAEEGEKEVGREPPRPRGRKPASRKADAELPEEAPAAKTSAAAETVTEAPTDPEDPADSAAVRSQLRMNHAST